MRLRIRSLKVELFVLIPAMLKMGLEVFLVFEFSFAIKPVEGEPGYSDVSHNFFIETSRY